MERIIIKHSFPISGLKAVYQLNDVIEKVDIIGVAVCDVYEAKWDMEESEFEDAIQDNNLNRIDHYTVMKYIMAWSTGDGGVDTTQFSVEFLTPELVDEYDKTLLRIERG